MEKVKNITRDEILSTAQLMTAITLMNDCAALCGKYAKQTLTRIEAGGMLTADIRKHVLDGYADMRREIESSINAVRVE